MESTEALKDKVHTSTETLLQALQSPEFYLELLMIGICLAVAWLLSMLVRRFVKKRVQELFARTPLLTKLNLNSSLFMKPLKLLAPVLSILLLGAAQGFAEQLLADSRCIQAAVTFAYAWLMVRLVLLVVSSRPVALFISSIVIYLAIMHVAGLGHYMRDYLASMSIDFGKYQLSVLGLVHGTVIFVVVFWLAGTITKGMESYLRRSARISYNARELVLQLFRVVVYAIAVLLTLDAMGVDLTALAVFGGALGVGVGLGLQKLTANFVSGVTLLLEKSVKIGDLIEVGGNTGWVRQLHTRYALIETFDGRDILVPNEELITSRVTNWTYSNDLARVEIAVPVDYSSDPHAAQKLMLEAAMSNPKCQKKPAPNCVLTDFTENGFKFLLTFWIPDIREGRAKPQSEVMLGIVDKFRASGIKMPVPAA